MDPISYRPLLEQVRSADLMRRTPVLYAAEATLLVVLVAGAYGLLGAGGGHPVAILAGLLAAFAAARIGYLGHDLGHHQVFRSPRANRLAGYVAFNLGLGYSFYHWDRKHSLHHRQPNRIGADPDLDLPVGVSDIEVGRLKTGLEAWLCRHQTPLLFPLLTLITLNLRLNAVSQFVLARGDLGPGHGLFSSRPWPDMPLMLAGLSWRLALPFVLAPWDEALLFVVLGEMVFGVYLGLTFLVNHVAMPTLGAEEALDRIRLQVQTARNLSGGRVTAYLFGGLDSQIEHHLFPQMPRWRLRHARPIVREACRAAAVRYHETSFARAIAEIFRAMSAVSALLRQQRRQGI